MKTFDVWFNAEATEAEVYFMPASQKIIERYAPAIDPGIMYFQLVTFPNVPNICRRLGLNMRTRGNVKKRVKM